MEEKMIYIPVEMFKEGVAAVAKCKAVEAIVKGSSYSVSLKELESILGIEQKEAQGEDE